VAEEQRVIYAFRKYSSITPFLFDDPPLSMEPLRITALTLHRQKLEISLVHFAAKTQA